MGSGVPFSVEQLWDAWERVRENAGCAGTDGVTVERFSRFADKRIPELFARVSEGTYRPWPLLRIVVEKKPGSAQIRTLLVPTVSDRVLQTAVARHLSHSFEEEFLECSYGYRPGRSVDRAIARIRKCHELGYQYVVDADVHAYFDNVDHHLLLDLLAARPLGPVIQGLLRQWVKAPVWDGSQVHPLHAGVPQGSPISPLLANYYLNHFDQEMEKSGRKLVRYADDFLVLAKTPDEAQQALLQTETLLAEAHLKVNTQKTHITNFEEGFRFLGALFLGDATWIPWKHAHQKGRVLFMARPLPANLRAKYEFAPPKSTMELALEKAEVAAVSREHRQTAAKEGEDVAILYLTEQGSILRKSGDRLLVEKEDEILLDIPYHKLETVLLFGNVQVTTQAMGELLEKGVGMSLFSRQGRYRGQLEAPRGKNIDLRIAQFEAFRDHERALGMARALVKAKVTNGLAVVDFYRAHNQAGEDFAERRGRLAGAMETCGTAGDIATLDGVEGAAAREYFSLLMGFNKSELVWPGRVRHPATDPLNALLSLTYTLIMSELTGLLEGAGLDPYLGFLHQVDYGRPSLALDVMEPFRHAVADRLVLLQVNQGAVDATDFVAGGEAGHGVFLSPKALKRYFEAYEKWMLSRADGSTGFRAAMGAEVEKLSAALRTGGAFEPWIWRRETEAACNT